MRTASTNPQGGRIGYNLDNMGNVTSMVYTALKIRGGFTITVIGPTERYAYRECIDKGLMPMGNKAQFLTGADLMAILYKAEVYIREH